jgi:hypothetical protein
VKGRGLACGGWDSDGTRDVFEEEQMILSGFP